MEYWCCKAEFGKHEETCENYKSPVFAEYVKFGQDKKFVRIVVRVGKELREVPIKFMRVSEIPALVKLLDDYAKDYAGENGENI